MKFIFLASFLLIFVSPGSTTAVTKGHDVILRLKRYDDHYAYTRAIFNGQNETSIYLKPRGYGDYLEFKRDDVIIDKQPLKDEVKPGVRVLAKNIGRNRYEQEIYIPARVTKKIGDKYEVKPACENKSTQLGFRDDYVYKLLPPQAFDASSVYDDPYQPNNARLYADITWCSANGDKKHPWLQVDLQENSYICSVTTQGYAKRESITEFTLAVSRDAKTWHHLMENNTRKIFERYHPADLVTHFVNLVDKPYRYIRFHSVTYHNYPCLAVEVNGYRKVKDPPHIISIDRLRMEGSVCKLQNKCVDKPNAECNQEGKTLGTYACRCKSGFQGSGLRKIFQPSEKYFKCSDIDECKNNACGKFADCKNIPGSFNCNCKKGFQQLNSSPFKCKDIDECSNSPCSPHARCTNTDGSFTCQCNHGYKGDGYKCVDIDECNLDDGTSKCKNKYSDCTNSPGSYKCTCQAGFTGDGNTCTDFNECDVDPNPCEYMKGKCSNNDGSYTCDCRNGYNLEAGKCQEIDECSNPDWNDCNHHAKCTNKPGSYSCECKKGFTGSGYNKFGCLDIDECSEKNKCGSHSSCENSEGSFTCTCDNGYTSHNGRNCLDIDECKTGKAICHHHSKCKNLPGSFTCLCDAGFTGKGDVIDGCTALSWCKWKGHSKCNKELRHCDNRLKKCTDCMSGYEEKNGVCQDDNECEKSPCDKSAACVNTPGSFKCHCKKGHLFDSKTHKCEDIDECSSTKRHCHGNAVCKNTLGSYTCKCKKGFDGDGFYCADSNECYSGNYTCPENSACSNTLGSYKCSCKMGYHHSENKCKKDVTSKKTAPKKNSKWTSLLDFLGGSGSTLRSQAFWKLLFLSATLIFATSVL